jgi:CDP-diacylglycerol--glycerol-3-phosphate 3-phosphatidyltransferase
VTLAAIILSLALGLALSVTGGNRLVLLLVGPVLFLRMALNAVDGMLAREHDQISREGMILNETGDVISDSAIIASLIVALAPFGASAAPLILFVFMAILGEFVGILGPQVGSIRRYDGPMGKSDRALLIGLVTFCLAVGVPGGFWLDVVFVAAALLAALGARNRAVRALKEGGK